MLDSMRSRIGRESCDAALEYISLGWSALALCPPDHSGVGPKHSEHCTSPGKTPWHKWKHRQETAATEQEIRELWRRNPRSNVGVALGPVSGLIRVDVDGEPGERMLAERGDVPETLEFRRGSAGSYGLLYGIPQGAKLRTTIHNGQGDHEELRFQAKGAQTVLPPSLHECGDRYVWTQGRSPRDGQVAMAPAWLIEELTEKPRAMNGPSRLTTLENDVATAISALWALSPSRADVYDDWLKVGMSLRSVDVSEAMLQEWERWSMRSSKYTEGQCRAKWASFNGRADGITLGTLFHMARQDGWSLSPPPQTRASRPTPAAEPEMVEVFEATREDGGVKPSLVLPGDTVSISDAGAQLGDLLAKGQQVFRRGAGVVQLGEDDNREHILRQVKPANLASLMESVCVVTKVRQTNEGPIHVRATCNEQQAKLILCSDAFVSALPAIRILSRCPVLVESNGRLIEVTGFDRSSGVLADGDPLPEITLADAVGLLTDMLVDFRFASDGDRSRALASIVTPAMVHGGLLGGRPPVDLGEADDSQTGKGFRAKLVAAVYRQNVTTVTQKKGGVGSVEEEFNSALIRGAIFPSFDNVRGKIDSPALESFLTEDFYSARQPYSGSIEIDPRRIVVMLTSNKAEITRDLANRSSCTRILKQERGYQFASFPEGDILDHVRANQPRYLAAVFRVVREWHRQGKPRTNETRHDFRRWAQTLDWIVQNVFRAAPLLDGHDEARTRMTNPALSWLREVAIVVVKFEREGWLRAHELLDILRDGGDGIEIPGVLADADLDEDSTRLKAMQGIGGKLSRCFRGKETVEIDGITIERHEAADASGRSRNEYRFSRLPPTSPDLKPRRKPAESRLPRTTSQHSEVTLAEGGVIEMLEPFGEVGEQSGKSGKPEREVRTWIL